jgi:tetraacyldisaccharide 4'-kinase
VISVGSLSAGGAGKTPVVIALAELLQQNGWAVDVLTRGYGREGAGVERVDPDAADAARRFGDEPVVIARRTGLPVWVGTQRFAAGLAAEAASAKQPRGVHLLDDGFQHRQLDRALDIVLVTEADLNDALLPAGNRREPLSALLRADIVVLRDEERARVATLLQGHVGAGVSIWTIRRQISFPETAPVLFSDVPTYGHIVFSAIARPADFVHMLKEAGVHALEAVAFPDHHAYTDEDVRRLAETFEVSVGNGFVTTEKDAVKLSPAKRTQLEKVGPLVVARLDSLFVDEAEVVRELEARLA